MIPSSSSHEQQQQQQQQPAATTTQQQQQEKKASQLFAQRALQERRLKPPDQVIACPRCQSLNTKFCYYNNYSLTQPRHFCKSCRRYWTAGGTLRNVPVGGGCRKNKRSKPRTPESSSSAPGSDLPPSASTLSVPSLPHPNFSSSSVNFLSSSEGTPPFDPQQPQPQQLIPFPPGHPHPFDSNIAQLNFFRNHSRPEPPSNLHPGFQMPGPGDLSEIFDTSTVARVGALTTLNEGLGTFTLESHGRDPAQFVSLERWKQQQQQQQQQQMRDGEGMDMSDVKGKMTLSMGPGGQRGWQAAQEANPALQHYQQQQQQQQQQQTTPEQNYWANPGWPSMDSQAFQSSGGGQAL
jgi:hypothetical protein